MAGPHGYFVWHELMSTDPAGAMDFYKSVVGWTITPGGIPGMDYNMWTTPRGPIGGVMELPKPARDMGAPTHWIAYVGSTDISTTVNRAAELGARTFVPVTDIPGVGQFAVLADPQGATFAVYQPATTSPDVDARPQVGDFSWHELATTDTAAAISFYSELFGWQEMEVHDMGPMGKYHEFGRDGRMFGGMFRKPAEMPGPSNWCCYVRVDDADTTASAVTAAGGTVINGPTDVPGGDRIAQCLDPQGGYFAVHAMTR